MATISMPGRAWLTSLVLVFLVGLGLGIVSMHPYKCDVRVHDTGATVCHGH